MRIIAGTLRGRTLEPPADLTIRPTSDKVRGAIFNILQHAAWAPHLFEETASVLDVFCGTGAFAFEALSRGMGRACLIDSARSSLDLARRNAEKLGLTAACRFIERAAHMAAEAPHPFQLIFLDPPYGKNLVASALATLQDKGWLAQGAVIVVECAKQEPIELPPAFVMKDKRGYGATEAMFMIYQ